jgi:hypothetical protein
MCLDPCLISNGTSHTYNFGNKPKKNILWFILFHTFYLKNEYAKITKSNIYLLLTLYTMQKKEKKWKNVHT